MGGKDNEMKSEVSVISVSATPKQVIDICSSPPWETEGTPLRPIFCLKSKTDMKEFEEKEDCFILDFDPDDISRLSVTKDFDASDSPDLSVIAEKGQIACRDYPHSRHVCVKFPFEKTPHESYCELCYCYVCDLAAPCKYWSGHTGHCHAIDNDAWKFNRRLKKQLLIENSSSSSSDSS